MSPHPACKTRFEDPWYQVKFSTKELLEIILVLKIGSAERQLHLTTTNHDSQRPSSPPHPKSVLIAITALPLFFIMTTPAAVANFQNVVAQIGGMKGGMKGMRKVRF